MPISGIESRERNLYIDRSIEEAIGVLKTPEARRYILPAFDYIRLLENAVVLNVSDEGIGMPEDHDADIDGLTIVAIGVDEEHMMLASLDRQTKLQKKKTVSQFRKWGAIPSAEAVYEAKVWDGTPSAGNSAPIRMHAATRAMTGMMAGFTDLSSPVSREVFPDSPEGGYLQINRRPTMILRMYPGQGHATPDILGHELAHFRQYNHSPVSVLTSQKSVDMRDLRDELEAYYIGALLARLQDDNRDPKLVKRGEVNFARLQIVVDNIRRAFNPDRIDPFRPSPKLLKQLSELGLDIILHQRVDFESVVACFENGTEIKVMG